MSSWQKINRAIRHGWVVDQIGPYCAFLTRGPRGIGQLMIVVEIVSGRVARVP